MLNIRKGKEPSCLASLRTTQGADWGSVHRDEKAEMRAAALREQGFLCAYCMRRIGDSTTMEHWDARATGADPFRWADLLAVCPGDLGGVPHCDRSKKATSISLHPARPDCDVEALVHVLPDGRLVCEEHQEDLDALNLNHATLRQNRRILIDVVVARCRGASLQELRRAVSRYEATDGGERPEYAAAALAILRPALQRAEGTSRRKRQTRVR